MRNTVQEYRPLTGDTVEYACVKLITLAPAFMLFNGVRVEAQPGDTPDAVLSRLTTARTERCRCVERVRKCVTEDDCVDALVAGRAEAYQEGWDAAIAQVRALLDRPRP